MTRLARLGLFPRLYDESSAGLVLAERELARLIDRHAAYARQPDVTPLWQRYVDQEAGCVASQQGVVERLRAHT